MFKRQGGYGRGRRMKIEKDAVEIVSGVRNGYTLGSPVTIVVTNDDFTHWRNIMGVAPISEEEQEQMKRTISKPRPGHADLVGGIKYNHRDLRNVLERSSARETAARVAVGAICKLLLKQLGINILSRVVEIGGIKDDAEYDLDTIKNTKTIMMSESSMKKKRKKSAIKLIKLKRRRFSRRCSTSYC